MKYQAKKLAILAIAGLATAVVTVPSASSEGPVPARATDVTYELKGPLASGDGEMTLFVHVLKRRGKPDKPLYIGAMFASPVEFQCDEGPFPDRSFSTQHDIPIRKNGKFKYNFGSFDAQFTGKITKKGKRAKGTASYGPNDTDGMHNCVLAGSPVNYRAKK